VRELLVLGRHGEQPGRLRSELRCELDGRPLLHEAVEIDGAHESRAILGPARAFGSVALLGLRSGSGGLELAGPGRVWRIVEPDAASLRSRVEAIEASALPL
jgi:urease accessory protein